MVTHQLQVERRTGKVRRPETDVLPLCHVTAITNNKSSHKSVSIKSQHDVMRQQQRTMVGKSANGSELSRIVHQRLESLGYVSASAPHQRSTQLVNLSINAQHTRYTAQSSRNISSIDHYVYLFLLFSGRQCRIKSKSGLMM